MTRVKISIAILAIMVIMSIISALWLDSSCGKLISHADSASLLLSSENKSKAKKSALQLEAELKDFCRTAMVMVKNERLSEAMQLSAKIPHLIESGSDEAAAELDELSVILESLRDGEKPYLNNIF